MKNIQFDTEELFDPEDYLYFYQNSLVPERLKAEIGFLIENTGLKKPKKILDLACGHGRQAKELARRGHQVTGIDITEGFIRIAESEAEKLGVAVDYRHDDMRNIENKEMYNCIFSLFTSIGYFDDSENRKLFQKIYNALLPGGFFCFDSHNRDAFLTYCQTVAVCEREENFMIDQLSFDTMTGRSFTRRTIIRKAKQRTFQFSVRFYNPTELMQIFEEIGFTSCRFFGGWDGSELQSDSKRMIVVAKK